MAERELPKLRFGRPPSHQQHSRKASLYIYMPISRAFCRIGEGIGRDGVGFQPTRGQRSNSWPGCTARLLCYHTVGEFESHQLQVIDTRKMGNLRSLPKLSRSHRFQFPSGFQLRPSLRKLSAANSIAFRVLFKASQASDVGSYRGST